MFIKNYHMIFSVLLMSGSIVTVSSNSWFMAWLGLEINLMSMIPLILTSLNPKLTEAAIKYFLSQAMASVIMIFSISMNFLTEENINLDTMEVLMLTALTLKTGMAPLHFWFPQVANNLSWTQCIIIFTWQKIAPLILLTSLSFNMISLVSMMSATVGALGGFNQTVLKLMMTYSSISHSGWMVLTCFLSFQSWSFYFLIYCTLSISIILMFNQNSVKKMKHIFTANDLYLNKITVIFNMFSLAGLPPFLGFAAKLTVLMFTLKMKMLMIFIILILSSILSLFFYTRVVYSNLMNMNQSIFNVFNKSPKTMLVFASMSTFLNLSTPLVFMLI